MAISNQLRLKIIQRDNWLCAYCFTKLEITQIHIDHIYPQSKGGKDLPLNLVTSCAKCNQSKSNKILEKPPIVEDIALEEGDIVEGTFEPYPIRRIRLSEEEWRRLKDQKLKSGLTWNNFIKQLLKDK